MKLYCDGKYVCDIKKINKKLVSFDDSMYLITGMSGGIVNSKMLPVSSDESNYDIYNSDYVKCPVCYTGMDIDGGECLVCGTEVTVSEVVKYDIEVVNIEMDRLDEDNDDWIDKTNNKKEKTT